MTSSTFAAEDGHVKEVIKHAKASLRHAEELLAHAEEAHQPEKKK